MSTWFLILATALSGVCFGVLVAVLIVRAIDRASGPRF